MSKLTLKQTCKSNSLNPACTEFCHGQILVRRIRGSHTSIVFKYLFKGGYGSSHKRTRNVTDKFSEVYRRVETSSLRVGLLDANSSSRIVLIDDSSLVVDDRSKKIMNGENKRCDNYL
jgi:hypothetical protein